MSNEFWLNKWETNDITFHEMNTNPDLIKYIGELNINSGSTIFVPFCGKTKDMLWLSENGFNVVGVELSKIACDDFFSEANITPRISQREKFVKYEHGNIKIFCGDLFDLTNLDLPTIHAVYDCKAIIALPPTLRRKYVEHIIECIGGKINFLLITRESRSSVTPPPYNIDKQEINLLFGSNFNTKQVKQLTMLNIPERLVKKGYSDITECAYIIKKIS
jgi:thiopurine S-methyltransferase